MKCCRCLNKINQNESLGGTYGGVVCIHHRVCPSCWWEETPQGVREKENLNSRFIPLVDKPRQNKEIECFGCLYQLKKNNYIEVKFLGDGTKNDPIIIK